MVECNDFSTQGDTMPKGQKNTQIKFVLRGTLKQGLDMSQSEAMDRVKRAVEAIADMTKLTAQLPATTVEV